MPLFILEGFSDLCPLTSQSDMKIKRIQHKLIKDSTTLVFNRNKEVNLFF